MSTENQENLFQQNSSIGSEDPGFLKICLRRLAEIWNSASPELRENAQGLLTNATEIITTTSLYFEELKPLKIVADNLVAGKFVTAQEATGYLKTCSNHPFVEQNKDVLFIGMTSSEACSDVVQQGMQQIMGAAADKILIVGLASGGLCAAIEGYKCYKLWELIQDAKNLVLKSPGQRERISAQVREIEPLVKSLDKAIADLSNAGITADDFECAKVAADYFINEIRIRVGEFLKQINELYVLVNGKREELRLRRRSAAVSAISGSVAAGAATTQAGVLTTFANPVLVTFTGVLPAIHLGIAIGNAALHIISAEKLEQLRKEVEQIEIVRAGLQIQRDADQKSKEVLAIGIGRVKKFDINKYK